MRSEKGDPGKPGTILVRLEILARSWCARYDPGTPGFFIQAIMETPGMILA
jgi:hypothetical protein